MRSLSALSRLQQREGLEKLIPWQSSLLHDHYSALLGVRRIEDTGPSIDDGTSILLVGHLFALRPIFS